MAKIGQFDFSQKIKEIKEKETKRESKGDERFWKLTREPKTEVGSAKIRFVPDKNGEPWIELYQHFVEYIDAEGDKKIYSGLCLTTLGKECPICKLNKKYWNSGFEKDKNIARARKRKQTFISNIVVIQDTANPENNGKQFLFSYGAKIQEKMKNVLFPPADLGEEPMVPWDFYEGADFLLVSGLKDGYINYDSSKFTKQSALFGGDENKIKEVLEKTVDLSEFTTEDKFDDSETIKNKLAPIFNTIPVAGVTDFVDESTKVSIKDIKKLEDTIDEDDIPF